MAEEHPNTVFLAENVQLADAVVKLLASGGIAAEAVAPSAESTTEPITGMSEMATGGDIEVRVSDPKKVKDARELLDTAASAAVVRAVREKRANRTGTVTAECEECGKSSEWPASAMGTTDTCPHCTAYMDIPDPDDDWSNMDFGEDEEEESSK